MGIQCCIANTRSIYYSAASQAGWFQEPIQSVYQTDKQLNHSKHRLRNVQYYKTILNHHHPSPSFPESAQASVTALELQYRKQWLNGQPTITNKARNNTSNNLWRQETLGHISHCLSHGHNYYTKEEIFFWFSAKV